MAYTTVATAKLDRVLLNCGLFCGVLPFANTFAGMSSGMVGQALLSLIRWCRFDKRSLLTKLSAKDAAAYSAVSHQFSGNSINSNRVDQSTHRRLCMLPMLLVEMLADRIERPFISYLNRQKESTIPIRNEACRRLSALPI